MTDRRSSCWTLLVVSSKELYRLGQIRCSVGDCRRWDVRIGSSLKRYVWVCSLWLFCLGALDFLRGSVCPMRLYSSGSCSVYLSSWQCQDEDASALRQPRSDCWLILPRCVRHAKLSLTCFYRLLLLSDFFLPSASVKRGFAEHARPCSCAHERVQCGRYWGRFCPGVMTSSNVFRLTWLVVNVPGVCSKILKSCEFDSILVAIVSVTLASWMMFWCFA